jgi:hypothetical protein
MCFLILLITYRYWYIFVWFFTTAPVLFDRLKMQKTMQNHAAVFRTGPVMREGIDKVKRQNNRIEKRGKFRISPKKCYLLFEATYPKE